MLLLLLLLLTQFLPVDRSWERISQIDRRDERLYSVSQVWFRAQPSVLLLFLSSVLLLLGAVPMGPGGHFAEASSLALSARLSSGPDS